MSSWDKYDFKVANNEWETILNKQNCQTVKETEIFDFQEVLMHFQENDLDFISKMINSLATGTFVLLRNSFSFEEIEFIKNKASILEATTESSFYKMLEGVPNFWRDITDELSVKYAVPMVKKVSYFFPMNEGSKDLFELVYPRWRLLKAMCGMNPFVYEGLTPKSGLVDRIQIVKYPPGSGYLAPHHDPEHNQRLIMSCYLSKRGVDFVGGGFWAKTPGGDKLNLEDIIEPGDIGICYANIIHGVDASELRGGFGEKNSSGNRWFMGLYTNDSDENKDRKTIRSA
jgi:hypothetical protein